MEYLRKLNVHPYTANVWFTNSRQLHYKQCIKVIGPREELVTDASGVCSYDDARLNLVIGLFNDSPYTLIHEIGHAVIDIFEGVGMPVNGDTSEAFCYLLDSMYKQAYTIHDKLREVEVAPRVPKQAAALSGIGSTTPGKPEDWEEAE